MRIKSAIGKTKVVAIQNFIVLANFGVRKLKHVAAPKELPKETGSLVEVTQRKYKKSGSGSTELLKG